jgi:transcriptional regulator with XRE-family HTH domain
MLTHAIKHYMADTESEERSFGAILERYLKGRGTSCAELARRLGTTRSAVSLWITGKTLPNPTRLAEIVAALDADETLLRELASALKLDESTLLGLVHKLSQILAGKRHSLADFGSSSGEAHRKNPQTLTSSEPPDAQGRFVKATEYWNVKTRQGRAILAESQSEQWFFPTSTFGEELPFLRSFVVLCLGPQPADPARAERVLVDLNWTKPLISGNYAVILGEELAVKHLRQISQTGVEMVKMRGLSPRKDPTIIRTLQSITVVGRAFAQIERL